MPMHYREQQRATAAYHRYRDRIASPVKRLEYDLDKIRAGLHPTIFSHDKGAAVNDALADAVRNGLSRLQLKDAVTRYEVDVDGIITLGNCLNTPMSSRSNGWVGLLAHRAPQYLGVAFIYHLHNTGKRKGSRRYDFEIVDSNAQVLKAYEHSETYPIASTVLAAQLENERFAEMFRAWCLRTLYPEYTRRHDKIHACQERVECIPWGQP